MIGAVDQAVVTVASHKIVQVILEHIHGHGYEESLTILKPHRCATELEETAPGNMEGGELPVIWVQIHGVIGAHDIQAGEYARAM